MKTSIRSLFAAALLLASLSACSKQDQEFDSMSLGGDMVRVSTFSAQIDSTAWTALEANYVIDGSKLQVSALRPGDSVSSTVSILIDNYHGVGFYDIDSNLNPRACYFDGISYRAQHGQIRVTQDDSDRLSGNFFMTATSDHGSIPVSDGKFTYYKQ